MTDLVILSLVAAALFSGIVILAYDWYSTVVWRRQFGPQTQPAQLSQPEPATDFVLDALPLETVKVVSR